MSDEAIEVEYGLENTMTVLSDPSSNDVVFFLMDYYDHDQVMNLMTTIDKEQAIKLVAQLNKAFMLYE